ncbi:uncharacterized protein [Paramormyrops kingsleyae]|uniref:uncharacterized protein n=1 Tax=Paramormyrops kingsleyae TaxID=1676925 RepID=UPI000CD608A0|nr:transcription factor HIVEP3-like [Paramormyrops kingsleyae]XP_023659750.1 transcription factor HIVEP3-like [Paramormyrops kingsleyae]XP_023659751.1 transcription factor HIVEP3-like [Paramormyrops kingsleyae]XP_023659752.1 transcription factor HIVEP3-like [Paramormyrops kingsleyae]XP_023659753.1 transcription factor HIVEP3-like [Paramormyrops kingsleyae]XP_023659754.1 transcription factor HIVEP3-like [Paramormyrops kingsleyae]XP_023659755.1 transcription factor HIVEP3-like [Paramormyrops ki
MSSEGESGQRGSTSSSTEEHGRTASQESSTTPLSSAKEAQGIKDFLPAEGAHAVKQRLALRLSERRHAPLGSYEEAPASLDLWSRGSTESGYFSRSDSGDWSQASPPNTEAKSYAEIILGKFGRLDQWHRNQQQQCAGSAEPGERRRNVPINVPANQVIEHITKLITINEALIDTREIDSVKPRRSSLSRKSSIEVPKISAPKAPASNSSGSVDVGLSRDPLHPRFLRVGLLATRLYTAPLLRSHSLPSPTGAADSATRRFRFSHSFDEWQASPAGKRLGRHHGTLRRQPALEVPAEPEPILHEVPHRSSVTTVMPGPWQHQYINTPGGQQKESKSYVSHCRGQEVLRADGSSFPTGYLAEELNNISRKEVLIQRLHKRQKEGSQEHEVDPSKVPEIAAPFPPTSTCTGRQRNSAVGERWDRADEASQSGSDGTNTGKGISVIQHTSSFEKKEKVFSAFSFNKDHHLAQRELPKSHSHARLLRQPSVQVPELPFTEEPGGSIAKPSNTDAVFQWPKRSSTLAQLPTEKLPPKKKCLRLAEAARASRGLCVSSLPCNSLLRISTSNDKIPQASPEVVPAAAPEGVQVSHTMTALSHLQHPQMLPSYSAQARDPCCPPAWNKGQRCQPTRDPICGASGQNRPSCQTSGEELLQVCPSNPDPAVLHANFSPSPASDFNHKTTKNSSESSLASPPPEPVTDVRAAWSPYRVNSDAVELSLCPVPPLSCSQSAVCLLPSPSLRSRSSSVTMQPGLQTESRPSPSLSQSQIPVVPQDPDRLPDPAPSELLRPVTALAVPVRSQTPVAKYGSAVYTTQSQIPALKQKDLICSAVTKRKLEDDCQKPHTVIAPSDIQGHQGLLLPLTPAAMETEKGQGSALSPARGLELSPDTEHRQKRAKREEETDYSDRDGSGGTGTDEQSSITNPPLMSEKKEEDDAAAEEVDSSDSRKGESVTGQAQGDGRQRKPLGALSSEAYPCLHTATSLSWCFLCPSPQSDTQPPGSSSQPSALPGLNSLGLSTRLALSLLQSKQKHRPALYTTASTTQPTASELLPAGKPQMSHGDMRQGGADERTQAEAATPSAPAASREPTPTAE